MEHNTSPVLEEYCIWEMESARFMVGVVGTGPGFLTILDIISNDEYHEFIPTMELVAVAAPPGSDQRRLEHVRRMDVPVYPGLDEMLAAHPEIDLLIELVGSRFRTKAVRATLPEHISLVDHVAAVFFCGMHNMLQAGQHCRVNLDRHMSMLRVIIDEVNEDIILLDKERRVIDMNRSVRQRLKDNPDEYFGKACWLVQTLEDGEIFCASADKNCPFEETLQTGKKAEALMTRVNEQGQLVYYRVYTYPVCDTQGSMTHIMVFRRNITARTMRERHQQQLDKLALMGEMSAYLAHEIRNPLFAISGFTNSLLRSEKLDASEREKLDIIAQETKRLDRMLKSMLDFARPSKEGQKPLTDFDPNEVARQTVELMRIGYEHQGYVLHLDLHEGLPRGRGDAEAVKQCLVNLLKNSIEAMPKGGEILVRSALGPEHVQLQVADNGPGMSAAAMDKAFSPFFSTKAQGYGMGLAMIKKVVDEFGGLVDLSSSEGKGVTVTMSFLPVLAAPPMLVELEQQVEQSDIEKSRETTQ